MDDAEEDLFVEPMRLWRDWYQKSERQWSEAITEVMADERMGKKFGRYFQEWLHAQHMFTEMVGQQLASINLPSRTDVLSIGDRLSEVEDTLSGLSAELHQVKKQMTQMATLMTATAEPAPLKRTRKPQGRPPETAKEESASVEKPIGK